VAKDNRAPSSDLEMGFERAQKQPIQKEPFVIFPPKSGQLAMIFC